MNGVTYDAGALIAAKHRNPVNASTPPDSLGSATYTPKTLVRGY